MVADNHLGVCVTLAVRQQTGKMPLRITILKTTASLGAKASLIPLKNNGKSPLGSVPPKASRSCKRILSSEDLKAKEVSTGSGKQDCGRSISRSLCFFSKTDARMEAFSSGSKVTEPSCLDNDCRELSTPNRFV